MLYFLLGFFVLETLFGVGMWAIGTPFWTASGPIITQGAGCAAAVWWVLRRLGR